MSIRAQYYKEMRDVCAMAWQRMLISGFNSNVSMRVEDKICVTRSGAAKGALLPSDLAIVDGQGTLLEGEKPSSELLMHLDIYANQPEALAIVHCHPRHMLALEVRMGVEDFLQSELYEAEKLRAKLGFAPALAPGSRALALAVGDAARHFEAVWMSRHGLTCWGPDLKTALALAEELDHLAAVQLLAL